MNTKQIIVTMSAVVFVILSITACVLLVMKVNVANVPVVIEEPAAVITPEAQQVIDDKIKEDAVALVKAEANQLKADALAKAEAEQAAKDKVAKAAIVKQAATDAANEKAREKAEAKYIYNGDGFDSDIRWLAEVDYNNTHGEVYPDWVYLEFNDFMANGTDTQKRLFIKERKTWGDGYNSEYDCRNPDISTVNWEWVCV